MNLQLTLALRYLLGRKLRTTLTTLAIVFGVLLIFGMNTLMPAFIQAFQSNAMAMTGEVDVTITNKTGEIFPQSVLEQLAAVEGVRVAAGSLERAVNLPSDYIDANPAVPDRITALTLIGVVPDEIRSVYAFNVIEGRFLQAGDQAAAVISESLADEAGLHVGDTLSLPTPTGIADLTVVGLLPQRLLPGNEEVLIPLAEAQILIDAPAKINMIEANFNTTDQAERDAIQANIEAALGSGYTIGVLQAGAEMLDRLVLGQVIINLLGGLGLLMGGFIIFNTFRTIIAERRRDIGMLRAVGASRRTITYLILTEGLIQGIIGTAIGLVAGYGLGYLALQAVGPIMQKFLNVHFGAPVITPGVLIGSIAMGVGITLLAGLLPARAASRITPLEALRPSPGEFSLRRLAGASFWAGVAMIVLAIAALISVNPTLVSLGGLLFVLGLIFVAPTLVNPVALLFSKLLALAFARDGTAQLAEGNLSRQPNRTAITAATTMIAIAVVVMGASLMSSLGTSFVDMLKKSLGSDYLLIPPSVSLWGSNVGASPELAENLRAIDGVAVVSSTRFASALINDAPVGLLGIEPRAYTEVSGLAFSQGDPEAAYQALESGRAMIINGPLAAAAGISLGDEVALLTPNGQQTYRVVGIASDFLNAKTNTAYVSHTNIQGDFGRSEDVLIQANLLPGADAEAVEAAFRQAIAPYPQFKLVAGQEYVDQNAGLLQSAFAGMYVMVIFLSIPSLIAMVNTLAIGVIERTREIGMLRAVGSTRRQVSTIILAEAIILSAIGTAFGIAAGLYLGYMATMAIGDLVFPMTYHFPIAGVLVAIAAGLIFGAIAAIIPARQAARMEIVQALRYE